MKKFLKLSAVFAALVMGLLYIASCSNNSDGSGDDNVLAIYTNTTTLSGATATVDVIFYENEKYEEKINATIEGQTVSNRTTDIGTYTGNPTVDGTVTIKTTKIAYGFTDAKDINSEEEFFKLVDVASLGISESDATNTLTIYDNATKLSGKGISGETVVSTRKK